MLPEPAQVRVESSLRETGGRPVNRGMPSPAMSGKMVRCSSSIRSWTSRAFQSCQILWRDGVGDDVLLGVADEPGELAPDAGAAGGVRIGHPVVLIGHERGTP